MLHEGIHPRSILALTFTNKAADEMQARLSQLAPGERVWMGTFHRFCARTLRQYASYVGLTENYTIYDTNDSLRVLKRAIEELNLELTHVTPERIAHTISSIKNNLITPENYQPTSLNPLASLVHQVYPAYQAGLRDCNAVDFDDLLLHVALLLRENPELRQELDARYRYIMVDEYQDTNLAQYAIVRALSIDYPNLAVTGDPDQSIYGWRGANLKNILDFEKDYPDVHVVRLEENYRSTKHILRVADALIARNVRRKKKSLFTANDDGPPVRLTTYPTHKAEAEMIAVRIATALRTGQRRARDFAVFYRVNALSRTLEFALREHGIPYQIVRGLEFFQRKEIKDVLAYLYLVNNPRDDVAFLRVINTPPRGIGRTTIDRLCSQSQRYHMPLIEAARQAGLIEGLNKRAAVAVAKFVSLYDRLCETAMSPVEEILGYVLTQTGYREMLAESDDAEDQERLANIEELLTSAREFDRATPEGNYLEAFLEQVSLVSDTDDWEEENDKVTLMTLHAAKGLEFPVVFIVAVEEGLLPHERSREQLDQVEEERRLLFVGITRAEAELEISHAIYREFRGAQRMCIPSQFLMDLPRDEMDVNEPTGRGYQALPEEGFGEHMDVDQVPPDADDFSPDMFSEEGSQELHHDEPVIQSGIVTAAQLVEAAGQMSPAVNPELFELAMVVTHPQYGVGKIVALSGSRDKRTATVQFVTGAGQRKFRLSQSPLRPAKPVL
jgi:DNA helicase-2/ATP-dependent DNA helicase PcrA